MAYVLKSHPKDWRSRGSNFIPRNARLSHHCATSAPRADCSKEQPDQSLHYLQLCLDLLVALVYGTALRSNLDFEFIDGSEFSGCPKMACVRGLSQ